MRIPRSRWLLVLALAAAACAGDPTQALEEELASVEGEWTGTSPTLELSFELTDGPGGTVFGTGTMKQRLNPNVVPITVTGSYQQPRLSLTFDGMLYDQQAVEGTWQGEYTTVGGILEPLQLRSVVVGTDYSREITILMQEK